MRKIRVIRNCMFFGLCILIMSNVAYASSPHSAPTHNVISSETQTSGKEIAASQTEESQGFSASTALQSEWQKKIPDDIIPPKIKQYILYFINCFSAFAAVLLVVAFAALAIGARDEKQLQITKKAVKILITSMIIINLFMPLLHFGLWMAGAL